MLTYNELRECPDCKLTDSNTYWEGERMLITVPNGMTFTVPGMRNIPFYSEFLLCKTHEKEM